MNLLGGHSRISQQRSAKNKKNRTLRVRNRGARERALIEAAAKLFADQGYEHTTTREIAAKAGCAEGLISRYFQGTSGLLRTIVESQIAQKPSAPVPLSPTIQEEIRRLVEEEVQPPGERVPGLLALGVDHERRVPAAPGLAAGPFR